MSSVIAFLSNRRWVTNLRILGYKPTERLSHRTFVFIPKMPFDSPAVVSKIPSDPLRKSKCCHGEIVGILNLTGVNRANEKQVEKYLFRLAKEQGFIVTKLNPMCTTCHSNTIFSVKRESSVAEPDIHVVAQEHIDFMGGQCCNSNSEPRWRKILRQLFRL